MELVRCKPGQKGLIHKEHEKGSEKRVWEGTTWQNAGQQAVSNNPNARRPEGQLRIRKTQCAVGLIHSWEDSLLHREVPGPHRAVSWGGARSD